MFRSLALAAGLGLAAGGASAQACLSVSDGLGNTALSCPDGRMGYIHSDGNGAAGGMIGTQPFAGSSASLAPPFGPTAGAPSTAFVDLPPPSFAPSPPQPPPAVVPLPPLSPAAEPTTPPRDALRKQTARARAAKTP